MQARIDGRAYVLGDFADPAKLVQSPDFRNGRGEYTVILAGGCFGRGTSDSAMSKRLRAAGVRAVVAESFAADFYRACRNTGDIYLVESTYRLCDGFETGDCVELNLKLKHLRDANGSAAYPLRAVHHPRPLRRPSPDPTQQQQGDKRYH